MGKSISIRRILHNPPLNKFYKPVQMTLPEGEEESETSYSLSQPSFMKDVDRFTAHHELKVDRYGRAHGKYFSFYYEPYNFTFYYDRARNLVYLCAKKKVVNSFIEDIGLSSN